LFKRLIAGVVKGGASSLHDSLQDESIRRPRLRNTERNVLFMVPASRSGAFEGVLAMWAARFRTFGIGVETFDPSKSTDWQGALFKLLETHDWEFAVSPMGMGRSIRHPSGQTVWDHFEVPLVCVMGDHPAYFPALHTQVGAWQANIYAYAEHAQYHLKNCEDASPHIAILPVCPSVEIADQRVVRTNKTDRIRFFKNGNDPTALRKLWSDRLPASIANSLNVVADECAANLSSCSSDELAATASKLGLNRPGFVSHGVLLDALLTSQIDDYVRREKSTLLAKVLSRFPTDIFGDNWGHVDFSGSAAIHHGSGTFQDLASLTATSALTIDMTPNAVSLPHERFYHSIGLGTFCITNRVSWLWNRFPELAATLTYEFTEFSIGERIDWALSNQNLVSDIADEMKAVLLSDGAQQEFVMRFVEVADRVRLAAKPQLQDYFRWRE
jgi:hypothetical protein